MKTFKTKHDGKEWDRCRSCGRTWDTIGHNSNARCVSCHRKSTPIDSTIKPINRPLIEDLPVELQRLVLIEATKRQLGHDPWSLYRPVDRVIVACDVCGKPKEKAITLSELRRRIGLAHNECANKKRAATNLTKSGVENAFNIGQDDRQNEKDQEIITSLEKEDYIVLSIDREKCKTEIYVNFICPKGHGHAMTWRAWKRGQRCGSCFRKNVPTLEEIRAAVEAKGYILLSRYYINNKTPLELRCPKGHLWSVTWGNFIHREIGCSECERQRRSFSLEEVRAIFRAKDYSLLSTEYINSKQKLKVLCDADGEPHEWEVCLESFQNGNRCPHCLKESRSPGTEEVRQYFKDQGYTLLATDYINNKTPMLTICSEGHKWFVTWDKFTSGVRCGKCYRQQAPKTTTELVRRALGMEEYVLLSTGKEFEEIDSKTKLRALCPNGMVYSFCWNNFQQGHRCPCGKCASYQSQEELRAFQYFVDEGFNVVSGDRSELNGRELDIYFPDHKVAVEYCGLYWHSERHKSPSYHRDKLNRCQSKGIRLITVFEDEWKKNREICLSRINNALGVCKRRIYARECQVREIPKSEAKTFLYSKHLQGYGSGCKIAFGLFYEGKLVQVMTFGALSRSHAGGGKRVLELKRLANELNMIIVGGASKLFKRGREYAKNNDYELIKSYCDLRWGTGGLYEKLGFVLEGDSKYTRQYTNGTQRFRNQALANRSTEITEAEEAVRRGWYSIYDCGHQTWVFDLKAQEGSK